jgi:uncharacterized membrane protein YfcA
MVSLSQVLPAVLGAYAFRTYRNADWNRGMLFIIAAGFYLGLQFVGRFPLIGSMVQFVAAAISIGFVYMILRKKIDLEPAAAPVAPTGKEGGDQDFV